MQHYLEARLWNDVFVEAQRLLDIPQGTIKATVLVEHILAAFQMEEILYELRHHSAGLNCGRWDYIFSFIKTFARNEEFILPDRAQVTMTSPFMRAYALACIKTCHKRGTFAMGGMAAFIPIKSDAAANEVALARVRDDKRREANDGHDGTWVAHPGLVHVAREEFDRVLGEKANQIHRQRDDVTLSAPSLLELPRGTITEEGLRTNIRVGIQYVAAWLGVQGCVPLYNLMEDAATAEISRTQVWQWIHNPRGNLQDGRKVTVEMVLEWIEQEIGLITRKNGLDRCHSSNLARATRLFKDLVTSERLEEFLTIKAYDMLTKALIMKSPNGNTLSSPRLARRRPTAGVHTSNGRNGALRLAEEVTTHGGGLSSTEAQNLEAAWERDPRWKGVVRTYSAESVLRLRGTMRIEHTLADKMSRKFWQLIHTEDFVAALGAVTGNQAVQMVQAGLKSIYLSGWQVAADNNLAGSMYPDQSLYPSNSVPLVVRRINKALQRADQIQMLSGGGDTDYWAPIVADAEAGFGGVLNVYELMNQLIEEGVAGVHFEDQLASAKKCGHMGGKVLVPCSEFVHKLTAARLAADVAGVPTVLIARTDAESANLLTSDFDDRDKPFCTGQRTEEGFFRVRSGLELAISRALAYAPYADVLWCETSKPNLETARRFAEAIKDVFPDKLLAYNCSPSFNWRKNLDESQIEVFQQELGKLGYKFQFVTLAGFHAMNLSMWELARGYKTRQMAAYTELQEREFSCEPDGYMAAKHQAFVGAGYFDEITSICGENSTRALDNSTEAEQFSAPQ
jgi:isocitrate lyase